jgi:hypothetical protein
MVGFQNCQGEVYFTENSIPSSLRNLSDSVRYYFIPNLGGPEKSGSQKPGNPVPRHAKESELLNRFSSPGSRQELTIPANAVVPGSVLRDLLRKQSAQGI